METMPHALDRFTPATRDWFAGAFGAPTAAQEGAWEAIAQGQHALVVAPTGSGKTLAAFLWALDRLLLGGGGASGGGADDAEAATPARHGGDAGRAGKRRTNATQVLYISPLKALGVDVERNLRAPLVGITQTARFQGTEPREISVGVRSGDTPAAERRALLSNPPDILITTPESLYLMLTSKARSSLTQVHTVIVDEVHAVAGTKRGAHLAVTLERLDQILPSPAQRIGLSATVEPVETVARFLGGTTPVTVVRPEAAKTWDLTVSVPVPDMSNLTVPVPREQPRVRTGIDRGSAASGTATLEDALGLDQIYVQAKRYAEGNTVGRETIQAFVGALQGRGTSRGVFITSSSFTRGAIDYAQMVPTRVILIDGARLAALMIKYRVGVQVQRTYHVVEIDEDFFE